MLKALTMAESKGGASNIAKLVSKQAGRAKEKVIRWLRCVTTKDCRCKSVNQKCGRNCVFFDQLVNRIHRQERGVKILCSAFITKHVCVLCVYVG